MKLVSKNMLLIQALLVGAMVATPAVAADTVSSGDITSLKAKSFEIPGSAGIRMVRIDKGSITMGSPAGEPGRWDDENQHQITISSPFYMAETETTQEQYIPVEIPDYKPFFIGAAAYEMSLPEVHSGGPFNTNSRIIVDSSKHPMTGVVWSKAVDFCNKLTEREQKAGRLPAGYIYRLPTEAEWEYACRAGTTGRFNVDDSLAKFAQAMGQETTAQVKDGRKPNAWGLYDMHGNVYEWCLDWYGAYPRNQSSDPTGPETGDRKVARGGCYISGKLDGRTPDPDKDQRCLRSAARAKFLPDFPLPITGFRVVLAPDLKYGSGKK